MADGAELTFDAGAFEQAGRSIVRRNLTAGANAVRVTTRALEQRLESATKGAVPGQLYRAWASQAYPRTGPAQDPAGVIYLNGGDRTRGAITFWTQPGVAARGGGHYYAVPLPAAGSQGRNRNLTPTMWEARTGLTLRPVFRPGRLPILVADNAVLSGKARVARGNTARRVAAGRGSATVPIFVLVPLIRFGNTVAVAPLVAQAERDLPGSL